MKRKSLAGFSILVLFGLCAVIWIANCVLDYVYGRLFGLSGGLRVVCAITWCAAFFAQLCRYLNGRKQEE